MDGCESLRTSQEDFLHFTVIFGKIISESPGEKDQLAVAVHRVIEYKLLLSGRYVVSDIHIFNLRPSLWAMVCFAAR